MKNDELEAPLESSWESPDKNIDRKGMGRLHKNIKDTWLKHRIPWRKRVGGRQKQRELGDGWNKHRWEELILDLADVEMIGSTWRENTPVEKELTWQSRLSRRISIHIGVWEHHLGKVWNQHLSLKQLKYHNSKQKQRIGLQNKPEQTYDRDFARSFHGGAYTGSIVQHHHVQGSAHDIWSVPESA